MTAPVPNFDFGEYRAQVRKAAFTEVAARLAALGQSYLQMRDQLAAVKIQTNQEFARKFEYDRLGGVLLNQAREILEMK